MKKMLLFSGALLLSAAGFSQVIVSVEEPAAIYGTYANTYSSDNNWGADLENPANAVMDTVVLANDSLACSAIVNNLSGKIALIYRGNCEYGAKALAAQNAGAVGVIIVNNVAGAPVGMLGGASGASVTIPVVMISQADGAIIHDQLATDVVVAYLGVKQGHFADDLAFTIRDVLRADANGMPAQLAQNASEFTTTLGAWVFNDGTNNQTGISLNVTVNNGAELYNETSTAFSLLSGDSAFISMPDFSLASYPMGAYTITYALNYGGAEGYAADNTVITDFHINDSIFSLCRLDAQGKPVTTVGTQPASNNGSYSSCVAFSNANASRIGIEGVYFSAAINAPDSLMGQEVLINAIRWDDPFTDLNDPNFGFSSLTEIATTSYYYTDNANNTAKYKAFEDPFVLEDGQRYLFCVQTFDTRIFFGYDENSNYDQNVDDDLQAFHPIESNGDFRALGFTGGSVPAIALKIFDADELSINENMIETSSFPNPAKDIVTVKVNASGNAQLVVTDLSGRQVASQSVSIANGQFTANVSEFKAGTYVFSLSYDNGTSSQFKVVVTK